MSSIQQRLREISYLGWRNSWMDLAFWDLTAKHRRIPLWKLIYERAFDASHRDDLEGVAPATLEALRAYEWSGNIRELSNVIHHTILLTPKPTITANNLPKKIRRPRPAPNTGSS